jgi:hypothetical protein
MKPSRWDKQPYDSEIYEVDCSDRVPVGAAISAADVKVFDEDGTDVSTAMVQGTATISGTNVYVQIKAGIDGRKYNVRIRLTLDNGEYAEDDIILHVKEKSI